MFDEMRQRFSAIYAAKRATAELRGRFDSAGMATLDVSDYSSRFAPMLCLSANDENPLLFSAIALADEGLAKLYVEGANKFETPNNQEFPAALSRAIEYAKMEVSRFYNRLAPTYDSYEKGIVSKLRRISQDCVGDPLFKTKLTMRSIGDPGCDKVHEKRRKAELDFEAIIYEQIKALAPSEVRNELSTASERIFSNTNQKLASLFASYISESLIHQGEVRLITISLFRLFGFEPSKAALDAVMSRRDSIGEKMTLESFILSDEMFQLFKLGDELLKRGVSLEAGSAAMSRFIVAPSEKLLLSTLQKFDSNSAKEIAKPIPPLERPKDTRSVSVTSESPATEIVVRGVTAQVAHLIEQKFERSNALRLARLMVYAAGKGGVSVADLLTRLEGGEEPEAILDCLKLQAKSKTPKSSLSAHQQVAHDHFEGAVDSLGAAECTVRFVQLPGKHSLRQVIEQQLSNEERSQVIARLGRLAYGSTGVTRAILKNFKSTGVYELKWSSALRVFYGATAEDEYTILGVARGKDQQSKIAEISVERLALIKSGEMKTVGFEELFKT